MVVRDVYAGIGRKGSLSGRGLELYAAQGALAWSPGLEGWWSLVSHKQEGVSAIDFKAGDGREIFATTRDGSDAGEIVAVDLHSGKRRRVAQISGWEGAGYELENSHLAVDSTHVYFLSRAGSGGPSIFRVRRDGSSRPESLGAGPWAGSSDLAFAVHDGHAYWFENKEGEPPGIVRRTLEFGSQPTRVANATFSPFHIANGRVYFVNDDAIWSVRPDGSEPTKHVEVGPAGASNILLDRGCLYWTNETEIRRAKLSDGPSTSSEIIADDRTYRGRSNIATDEKHLYWFDLRRDRILRLGRDAASLTPRPRLVAKSVPFQRAPRVRDDSPSAAVVVNLGPPPIAVAAAVDFAAPEGTFWPEPYLIHHDCASPARAISKCPAGTTGEPWSSLVGRAPALVGHKVSVRDRLFVGPPGNRNSNSFWAACSRSQPDPSHRTVACETEVQSTVLGEGDPPLFLTGIDATCMGDESRLCCGSPALGQTVVATGVLERHQGWFLGEPTMCEPVDADPATDSAKK